MRNLPNSPRSSSRWLPSLARLMVVCGVVLGTWSLAEGARSPRKPASATAPTTTGRVRSSTGFPPPAAPTGRAGAGGRAFGTYFDIVPDTTTLILAPTTSVDVPFTVKGTGISNYATLTAACGNNAAIPYPGQGSYYCTPTPSQVSVSQGTSQAVNVRFTTPVQLGKIDSVALGAYWRNSYSGTYQLDVVRYRRFRVEQSYTPIVAPADTQIWAATGVPRTERFQVRNAGTIISQYEVAVECPASVTGCAAHIPVVDYPTGSAGYQGALTFTPGAAADGAVLRVIVRSIPAGTWGARADTMVVRLRTYSPGDPSTYGRGSYVEAGPADSVAGTAFGNPLTLPFWVRNSSATAARTIYTAVDCGSFGSVVCTPTYAASYVGPGGTASVPVDIRPDGSAAVSNVRVIARVRDAATDAWYADTAVMRVSLEAVPYARPAFSITAPDSLIAAPAGSAKTLTFTLRNNDVRGMTVSFAPSCTGNVSCATGSFPVTVGGKGTGTETQAVNVTVNVGALGQSGTLLLVGSVTDPAGAVLTGSARVTVWPGGLPLPVKPLLFTPARMLNGTGPWAAGQVSFTLTNQADRSLTPSLSVSCGPYDPGPDYSAYYATGPCGVSKGWTTLAPQQSGTVWLSYQSGSWVGVDTMRVFASVTDPSSNATRSDTATMVAYMSVSLPSPASPALRVSPRTDSLLGQFDGYYQFRVDNLSDRGLAPSFNPLCEGFPPPDPDSGESFCSIVTQPGLIPAGGAGYVKLRLKTDYSATTPRLRLVAQYGGQADTGTLVINKVANKFGAVPVEVTPKGEYNAALRLDYGSTTVDFQVKNLTAASQYVSFMALCDRFPAGTITCPSPTPVTLLWGESAKVPVTIQGDPASAQGRVRLVARVQDALGTWWSDTGAVTANIGDPVLVSVAPHTRTLTVVPGQVRTDTFTVTNLGVASAIAVTGSCGAFTSVECGTNPLTEFTLRPGEGRPVTLKYRADSTNGSATQALLVGKATLPSGVPDTARLNLTASDNAVPWIKFSGLLANQTITSPTVTVTVQVCDPDGRLRTPVVSFNGSVLPARLVRAAYAGCLDYGTATYTLTASPGAGNQLVVNATDGYHPIQAMLPFRYNETATQKPSVTPVITPGYVLEGQMANDTFTVKNGGTVTSVYQLTPVCGVRLTPSCLVSQQSVSLAPGESRKVAVTYMPNAGIAGPPAVTDTIRLRARYMGTMSAITIEGIATRTGARDPLPYVAAIFPAGSTTTSSATTDVFVRWCEPYGAAGGASAFPLTSRKATINGSTLPDVYSSGGSTPGCRESGTSMYPGRSLVPGTQEIVAEARSNGVLTSQVTSSVTYLPPSGSYAVTVSPKQVTGITPRNASAATTPFVVRNAGSYPVTVDYSADCGGLINCATSKASQSIAAGATDTVKATFTTPDRLGDTATVRLIAKARLPFHGAVADTGSIRLTTPTAATMYQPSVEPLYPLNVVRPGWVSLVSFFVTNTGTDTAVYRLDWTLTGGFTLRYTPVATLVVPPGVTVVHAENVVAASENLAQGTVRLIASAMLEGQTVADTGLTEIKAELPTPKVEAAPRSLAVSYPVGVNREVGVTFANTGNVDLGDMKYTVRCEGAAYNCRLLRNGQATADTAVWSSIARGGSEVVSVLLDVSNSVPAGRIRIAGRDGLYQSATDTAVIDLAVDGMPLYWVAAEPATMVVHTIPGGVGSRGFTVRNTGNAASPYRYTVSCDPAALCISSPPSGTTVELQAGASASIPSVEWRALAAGTGTITLQVVSVRNDFFTATAKVSIVADMKSPVEIRTQGLNPGVAIAREQCLTVAAGAGAAYECGDLRLVLALPTTTTYTQARTPTLIYNSRHATGSALVTAEIRTAPGTALDSVQLWASVRGAPSVRLQTYNWNRSWNEGEIRRVTTRLDTAAGPARTTGLYQYTLEARGFYNGSPIGANPTAVDTVVIVDRRSSPFGAGWWLDGLEQLVFDTGDSTKILWVGGDGSSRLYSRRTTAAPVVWVSTQNISRPDSLIQVDDRVYYRRLRNGAAVKFDGSTHVETQSRTGLITRFSHDSGTLARIELPAPGPAKPTYSFTYLQAGATRQLQQVSAPSLEWQQRVTRLVWSGAAIRTIVDPDLDSVRFVPTGVGREIKRVDRRGNPTYFRFDAAGLLQSVRVDLNIANGVPQDSSVTTFCAAESRGMNACAGGPTHPEDAATTMDGPQAGTADTWRYYLNRFGGPDTIVNPFGVRTRIERDSIWPALAKAVVMPNGFRTEATYDPARGLLRTVTAIDPLGPGTTAVTSYTWHPKWDQPATIVPPAGPSTSYSYDAAGNRDTVRVGKMKTVFTFWPGAGSLVRTVNAGMGVVDTFFFGAQLGNLDSTVSPTGIRVTNLWDGIGQLRRTARPIDATRSDTSEFVYDLAGQLEISKRSAGGQWHRVQNGYDPEGNLTSVVQTMSPDPNGIGTIERTFEYDEAGRQIKEYVAGRLATQSVYDAAGNLLTGGRQAIGGSLAYDRMNRVTTRLGTTGATFEYDSISGFMLKADNKNARIRRTYYPNGLLKTDSLFIATTDWQSFEQHRYGLTYRYDKAGRRIGVTYPLQLRTGTQLAEATYGYDPGTGALASVGSITGAQFAYTYDSLGRLDRLTGPHGLVDWRRSYDKESRLTGRSVSWTGATPDVDSLTYDFQNRVRSAGTDTIGYGPLGPVEYSSTQSGGTERLIVDPLGNRAEITRPKSQPEAYFYEPGTGRLQLQLQTTLDALDSTFTYSDDLGNQYATRHTSTNVTLDTARLYPLQIRTDTRYDEANRMVMHLSTRDSSDSPRAFLYRSYSNYRYDALGRRVWYSTVRDTNCLRFEAYTGCTVAYSPPATVTRVIWDGDQMLYEIRTRGYVPTLFDPPTGFAFESDSPDDVKGGVVGYTHGVGIDKPLEILKGTTVVTPLYNWRGLLARGLCGDTLCTSASIRFPQGSAGLFGQPAFRNGTPNWYGSLIEGQRDDGSGLIYQRNRYLDANTGRFTQEDPVGLAGGLNVYGFGGSDPVNYSDPFGLCPGVGGTNQTSAEDCPEESTRGFWDRLWNGVRYIEIDGQRQVPLIGVPPAVGGRGFMNNRTLDWLKIGKAKVAVDAEIGGSGLAQVHVQIKGGAKTIINSLDDLGELPKRIRTNADVQAAIRKAFEWLEKVQR